MNSLDKGPTPSFKIRCPKSLKDSFTKKVKENNGSSVSEVLRQLMQEYIDKY